MQSQVLWTCNKLNNNSVICNTINILDYCLKCNNNKSEGILLNYTFNHERWTCLHCCQQNVVATSYCLYCHEQGKFSWECNCRTINYHDLCITCNNLQPSLRIMIKDTPYIIESFSNKKLTWLPTFPPPLREIFSSSSWPCLSSSSNNNSNNSFFSSSSSSSSSFSHQSTVTCPTCQYPL